jgi:photosystem II stability/assembly factor-like uncharacterized protein
MKERWGPAMSALRGSFKRAGLMVVAVGLGLLVITSRAHADSNGPYRWKNVQIVGGGFITGIQFHPKEPGLAYVRTDIGGSYRWDVGGARWVPLNDSTAPENWNLLGVESIGLDPTNPDIVYEAVGDYTETWASNGAILRSFDRGRTWQRTRMPIQMGSNEEDRYSGERLAVNPASPNVVYFGSRENGLWLSKDHARTWAQVGSFPVTGPVQNSEGLSDGVIFVKFGPSQSGSRYPMIYVGVSAHTNNLYSSIDNGSTWQPVPGAPTGVTPTNAALSPDGSLYVTYSDLPGPNSVGSGLGRVYKFNTSTSSWTDVTPLGPYAYGGPFWYGFANVVVDPESPQVVMVTTMDAWWPGDNVMRSTDGGTTWKYVASMPEYPLNTPSYYVQDWSVSPWITFGGASPSFGWWMGALAVDPFDSNHVLYGTGATIWATQNMTNIDSLGTVNFSIGAAGIEETAVIVLLSPSAGPAHLLSGVADLGGFTHTNLDQPPSRGMWTNPVAGAGTGLDYSGGNPLLIARTNWANSQQYGAYSMDGGLNWTPFATQPAQTSPGSIAVLADGKTIIWAPGGGAVTYSADFGASWVASAGAPSGFGVVADKLNPSKAYIFNSSVGVVYVSNDGGATFSAAAGGLPTNGTLNAVYSQAGDLWLTTSAGHYRSVDGGTTFAHLPNVLSAISVGFGMPHPGRKYPAIYLIGTLQANEQAIFRSIDRGASWTRINDDQHQYGTQVVVTGDPRVYGRVYLGTNGRGVLYGDPLPGFDD